MRWKGFLQSLSGSALLVPLMLAQPVGVFLYFKNLGFSVFLAAGMLWVSAWVFGSVSAKQAQKEPVKAVGRRGKVKTSRWGVSPGRVLRGDKDILWALERKESGLPQKFYRIKDYRLLGFFLSAVDRGELKLPEPFASMSSNELASHLIDLDAADPRAIFYMALGPYVEHEEDAVLQGKLTEVLTTKAVILTDVEDWLGGAFSYGKGQWLIKAFGEAYSAEMRTLGALLSIEPQLLNRQRRFVHALLDTPEDVQETFCTLLKDESKQHNFRGRTAGESKLLKLLKVEHELFELLKTAKALA